MQVWQSKNTDGWWWSFCQSVQKMDHQRWHLVESRDSALYPRFEAKKNFIESSAAYSLVVYFLQAPLFSPPELVTRKSMHLVLLTHHRLYTVFASYFKKLKHENCLPFRGCLAMMRFEVKDRHNGNLMLLTSGHVVHIDFGQLHLHSNVHGEVLVLHKTWVK